MRRRSSSWANTSRASSSVRPVRRAHVRSSRRAGIRWRAPILPCVHGRALRALRAPGAARPRLPFAFGQVEVRADDAHDRAAGLAADREIHARARGCNDRPCAGAGIPPRRFAAPRATLSFSSPARGLSSGCSRRSQALTCGSISSLGVAEHLLPPWRIHDGAGLEVPVPDAFLRAGERQREPLLAFPQRRLGALALGEVEMGADDSHTGPPGSRRIGNPRESTWT